MPEIPLALETGRALGSPESRRLRARGKIPAVVYGHSVEPTAVAIDARDLRLALATEAGSNVLLSLTVGGVKHLALAREIQRHPLRGNVLHVDFHVVRHDQPVPAEIPVTLVGDALQVHHVDGIVEQQLFTLAVKALPAEIPSGIEVDVSGLAVGSAIRVGDLPLPAGVTVEVDAETTVVAGHPPRVHVEALEEGVEGEAAAAESTSSAGREAADAGSRASGSGAGGEV